MNKQTELGEGFEILTASRVDDVGSEAWDSLSAGRPFQSARWYRFGERAMQDCQPVYIILSRAGKSVARGTFWIVRTEPLPVAALIRTALRPILQRWPLMICRVPLLDLSGLILPEEPALRRLALKTIASTAQREASRYNISFILFPFLEAEESRQEGWPPGFGGMDLPGPSTCLQVAWPDFESYLRQLPRATRKYYRHNRSHAEELSIQVCKEEHISPQQIIPFIRNVEKHHKSAPNPWVGAILENVGMLDATWFTARAGGKLAGCLLTFKEQEYSLLSLIGLDYTVPYVYFKLLYAAIGAAIKDHSKTLWGGSGAYPFKQSMGFQLTTNTWAVLAGRNPLLQRFGFFLARWAN